MGKTIIAGILATIVVSAHASNITLSEGIRNQLKNKIEQDLSTLDNLKFKSKPEENTLKLMEMAELNSTTATSWLEARVHYVIEENALSRFKLLVKNSVEVERENVTFPNAGILPYSLDEKNKSPRARLNKEDNFVVMSNVGANLYLAGKNESTVYRIKIGRGFTKKAIRVPIESPRAGIIQIGEGLFIKQATVNNENPDSIANSINRLGNFFHEARHSDGNKESLAFLHSPCPSGHDYAGAYACDESLNGPYSVGAAMTKEMLKACDETCTEREKEVLKIFILDSQSRVLHTTRKGTPAKEWDTTPEGL